MNKSSQFTFFLQTCFLIMIKILFYSSISFPKMIEMYHCYLEILLHLTALQIDSTRTWNQENNSIEGLCGSDQQECFRIRLFDK